MGREKISMIAQTKEETNRYVQHEKKKIQLDKIRTFSFFLFFCFSFFCFSFFVFLFFLLAFVSFFKLLFVFVSWPFFSFSCFFFSLQNIRKFAKLERIQSNWRRGGESIKPRMASIRSMIKRYKTIYVVKQFVSLAKAILDFERTADLETKYE